MTDWTESPEWWELVNRAAVIRAGAEFGADGGLLVLTGPAGFGHLEAAGLALRQIRRFGWECHDVSSDGPFDAAQIVLNGLEAIFPTAANGVNQKAQLAGLGTSLLGQHARDLCSNISSKHCLIAPYADATHPLERSDLNFLQSIANHGSICFLLTSTRTEEWNGNDAVESVELGAFSIDHVQNCLIRGSNKEGFAIDEAMNLRAELEHLSLADGTIVPQAAYTWLRAHGASR